MEEGRTQAHRHYRSFNAVDTMTAGACNATGAHLTITPQELFRLRHVARGTAPPTLIIQHGTLLSVHTGELLERDVVLSGRHIAAVTPWDYFPRSKYSDDAEIEEIDARGRYISPGFIDTHIHIEYTKLVPGELARLSVPRGTTTVLADANCIANVGERSCPV